MTTPSGPITLGNVQTEFGGSNPISLSEYYRGGAYVNSATAAGTSGVQIATSGAIRLGDFRAVTAAAPTNFGGQIWRTSIASVTATGGFNTNGDIYTSGSGSLVTDTLSSDNWYTPNTTSIGNSYWLRATLTSGTTPSSGATLSTWLQLNSARQWSNTRSTIGTKTSTLLVEIASDSGGSNIVCSGTVTITADMDS